eukprot:TRINITY_DN15861_c0_g1_i2.p1 TRINITY_DN15861_c0_g1~~TRINITY_DN15861_c0_g1_i2.p1  ORF type:complete len:204 (+),score=47.34 TRINITY_DN15861_c0_g1_i2:82-612(+)
MVLLSLGFYNNDADMWVFSAAWSLLRAAEILLLVRLGLDVLTEIYIAVTGKRAALQTYVLRAKKDGQCLQIEEDMITTSSGNDIAFTPEGTVYYSRQQGLHDVSPTRCDTSRCDMSLSFTSLGRGHSPSFVSIGRGRNCNSSVTGLWSGTSPTRTSVSDNATPRRSYQSAFEISEH